uniref:Hylareleasin 9 n=1 Tax=Hyla simplex TaxID=334658 RepID=H6SWM4_9NEOB|nr:hylareleasin 9 [Hyla simplex]
MAFLKKSLFLVLFLGLVSLSIREEKKREEEEEEEKRDVSEEEEEEKRDDREEEEEEKRDDDKEEENEGDAEKRGLLDPVTNILGGFLGRRK